MTEEIRRQHPFTAYCRSCGQAIVWFKTKSGKNMPVDEKSTKPTDRTGEYDPKRHISHFATCPDADQHRKLR